MSNRDAKFTRIPNQSAPKTLDASHQIRKLATLRARIMPDLETFLALLNEGLLVYDKTATQEDVETLERAGVADIDTLSVYANLLGTKVRFDGADDRPLVSVPGKGIVRRIRRLLYVRDSIKALDAIDESGFTPLTILVFARDGEKGAVLPRFGTKLHDRSLWGPLYALLKLSREREVTAIEDELRILQVREGVK